MNSFGAARNEEIALHPTVKPVAMIADAIKDVSSRNAIVLDLFGGSGSTLIAAHKTGRRGFLCELDPLYCDLIIRRWQVYAKDDAVLEGTGRTFDEMVHDRAAMVMAPASENELVSTISVIPTPVTGLTAGGSNLPCAVIGAYCLLPGFDDPSPDPLAATGWTRPAVSPSLNRSSGVEAGTSIAGVAA